MIEKKYLKTKPVCKVKFILNPDSIDGAKSINLVGEFNDWDTSATPLRKQKNGTHAVTLDLDADKQYQFRYLLDEQQWINDEKADAYIPNNLTFEENSVVVI